MTIDPDEVKRAWDGHLGRSVLAREENRGLRVEDLPYVRRLIPAARVTIEGMERTIACMTADNERMYFALLAAADALDQAGLGEAAAAARAAAHGDDR